VDGFDEAEQRVIYVPKLKRPVEETLNHLLRTLPTVKRYAQWVVSPEPFMGAGQIKVATFRRSIETDVVKILGTIYDNEPAARA
jgi:hypothetical protein